LEGRGHGHNEYAPEATVTGKDGAEELYTHRGHAVIPFPTRRLSHRGLLQTVDHAFEEQQLSSERRRFIEAALTKLPELEASTIRAHFFGDRNFADIGRERDLTREGVRKAFNRGLAKLKELLAEHREELC
jgi:DNA-directed RNA polymerase specialized sigma24 family protein